MTITQTMLDVCEEALYLLRQDVSLPTLTEAPTCTDLEWTKCRKAFDYAATEVLAVHDWLFARGEGADAAHESVDGWPPNLRKVLVYCLARELAVQIAGRTEDLKNWNALYTRLLAEARVKDLDEDESDDEFVRQVVALLKPLYTPASEDLPRSMAQLYGRIADMRDLARREVLSAHPWAFAMEEDLGQSGRLRAEGLGEYVHWVAAPEDCLKVVGVFGRDGELLQWERCAGQIRALAEIRRVTYVRNVEDLAEFSPDAYRLVVLRLVADMARAMAVKGQLQNLHETIYRDALAEAKVRDARQSNPSKGSVWGPNHYVEEMERR